jgi:hypothetical protein
MMASKLHQFSDNNRDWLLTLLTVVLTLMILRLDFLTLRVRPSRQQFVNLNRHKISNSRNGDGLLNVSFTDSILRILNSLHPIGTATLSRYC